MDSALGIGMVLTEPWQGQPGWSFQGHKTAPEGKEQTVLLLWQTGYQMGLSSSGGKSG